MAHNTVNQVQWSAHRFHVWAVIPEDELFRAFSPGLHAILATIEADDPDVNIAPEFGLALDLISINANFSLNEIPSATLIVPLGRRVDTLQPSTMNIIIDHLKWRLKIFVYMRAVVTSGNAADWPKPGAPQVMKLFEGYITGGSMRKTFGGAEMVLFVEHWLSDLNFASMLTQTGHPANPVSLSFNASLNHANKPAGGTVDPRRYDGRVVTAQITMGTSNMLDDFWGFESTRIDADGLAANGGLKLFLKATCKQDRFNWASITGQGIAVQCPRLPPTQNINPAINPSLAALRRIEPREDETLPPVGLGPYRYGVPLKVDETLNSIVTAGNLAYDVVAESANSLANTTMWDRLVSGYAPNYRFAIVPLIDRALIVPFTPGLRRSWRTLHPNEYDSLDITSSIPHRLRGVVLLVDKGLSATNVQGTPPDQIKAGHAGSFFDTCQEGMIMAKSAPPWISNPLRANLAAYQSLLSPQATSSSTIKTGPILDAIDNNQPNSQLTKDLWRRYAKALYLQEVLRHRQATLSGKLRFDICPGSQVTIDVAEDKFVAADLSLRFLDSPDLSIDSETREARLVFGSVLKVSFFLNAESQQAGTSFQIGFLRDKEENEPGSPESVNQHPIWSVPWAGAPLITEFPLFPL